MNRYRKAFGICLISGPIMVAAMLLSGNILSTSLVYGFGTMVIALTGLHLGVWAKSTA